MMCVCVIACALRWGVALIGKFSLLAIAHPVVGKYFQVLEVHWGMKPIQELSYEGKARFGFVMYFVNFGKKTQFVYVERTEL